MSSFIATSSSHVLMSQKFKSYKQYESAGEDSKRAFTLLYKFFFAKNASNRLRRCGTLREPKLCALSVDFHLNGVRERVVLSHHLQKTPVSGTTLIDHDNPVVGPFLRPDPG